MKEVYLSREIDNTDGYIDQVVSEIKSVPQNEELHMLITCVGGDTFQGDRIYRAVLEHGGKTTATVVGCAISMGASILPAFDSVLIDEGAEIMLHKANIPSAGDDLNTEQEGLIKRFNAKTYQRMLDMGVDEKFLSDVFLSDKDDNYWLTPSEAEGLGIGKVVSADRDKLKNQFAVAARLDISKIKNQDQMNLFKKAVPRIVNLADGRQAIFSSKETELKVGDKLTLANSDESLGEQVKLENNLLATLAGDGTVEAMEEVEEEVAENMVSKEAFDELVSMMQTLRSEFEAMKGEKADENAEVEAALANKEEEIEAKNQEAAALVNKAEELLASTVAVAEGVKTSFKLDKIEDKREEVSAPKATLDAGTKRALEMRKISQQLKESK